MEEWAVVDSWIYRVTSGIGVHVGYSFELLCRRPIKRPGPSQNLSRQRPRVVASHLTAISNRVNIYFLQRWHALEPNQGGYLDSNRFMQADLVWHALIAS